MLKSLFPLSLKTSDQGKMISLARSGLISGTAFVVPRSQCHFERIWTPRADQKGIEAVKLSVAQNTHLDDPGIFVESSEDGEAAFLNCWIWDQTAATETFGPNSLILPETVARAASNSRTRLVACLQGYEGQIWDRGALIASRWWRSAPTHTDWLEFVEGSEVTIGALSDNADDARHIPEIEEVSWRDDVSLTDFGSSAIETTVSPMRAFVAACVIVSLPFAYLLGASVKLNQEISQTETQLEQLQVELGDVADARRTSVANRAIIDRYTSGGDPFKMINVLEEFGLATKPSQVTVRQLSYNGDSIEIKFSADERMLLPDLIRKLELSSHWISANATTSTNGEIILRGRLSSERPDS